MLDLSSLGSRHIIVCPRNGSVALLVSVEGLEDRRRQDLGVCGRRDDPCVQKQLVPLGIELTEIEKELERIVANPEVVRVSSFKPFDLFFAAWLLAHGTAREHAGGPIDPLSRQYMGEYASKIAAMPCHPHRDFIKLLKNLGIWLRHRGQVSDVYR